MTFFQLLGLVFVSCLNFHLVYLSVVEFLVSLWPPLVSASSLEDEKR